MGITVAGCQESIPTYDGVGLHDLFPFDGERTWTFLNEDIDVSHFLTGVLTPEPEHRGEHSVYRVDYGTDCRAEDPDCIEGEVLRTLLWSSSSEHGVFLHGYELGEAAIDFDPPVQVAARKGKRGDSWTTTTAGASWTSTFVGMEWCPVDMAVEWSDCGHFEISTTTGDGHPVVGDYWAKYGYNVVAVSVPGDPGMWQLSDHDCAGDCSGIW
jgi:hypothetical protein